MCSWHTVTGVPVYTIRGVGFDDYSVNSSGTVGIYVDEVSLPYPTMTRGAQFDVERIEVLKGPQGTLYGRNTTGRAINFISNKPSDAFEAGVTLDYGRYDTFKAEGFINGGLSEALNGRLALSATRSDEGWQNSVSSNDTLGEQDTLALKGLLEWRLSDAVNLLFKLHWYEDQSHNLAPQFFTYVPLTPGLGLEMPPPASERPDLNDPRSAEWSRNFTPERDNTGIGASITVNWDLEGFTLTSITAYETFDRDESNDWDGATQQNLDTFNNSEIDAWSQEIRLTSNTNGDLAWIFGLYLSHDEVDESYFALIQDATVSFGVFGAVDTRYDQEADTQALFGHLEWMLTEQWRLNLGLLYTREEREFAGCGFDVDGGLASLFNTDLTDFDNSNGVDLALSSTPLNQGDCVTVDQPVFGTSAVFEDDTTFDNVSGKIGIDWLPSEDWLIYASFGTGFKSGGYNGAATSTYAQLQPYDEEELTAYEVGFKATLLDGTLQFNASTYYYDYEDKQIAGFIADPVFNSLTAIVNVPESEVFGAEAEVQWQPLEELYLKLGTAWLDTEVKKFVGFDASANLRDLSGLELAQTAEWQHNGLITYQWPVAGGLLARVSADFTYSDDYQAAIDNNPLFFIDDYFTWGARAGIGAIDDRWQLTLWGRNLSDEYYYTSATFSNDTYIRTGARGVTYGIMFNYNWR